MNFNEWVDLELSNLREELRLKGFTPPFADDLAEVVRQLLDTAHDMEFEDVVHDD